MQLIDPKKAQLLVLDRATSLSLPAESVDLNDALGRILADDVTSSSSVPGFDNSAMDGFAVRAVDTEAASRPRPVALSIVDESRAGKPASAQLTEGQAIRISTGAMLPRGADTVVRLEDVVERDGVIELSVAAAVGGDVRYTGEDINAGDLVIERGGVLGSAELGVLASVGMSQVSCVRRPQVAVLITGDELVDPHQPLQPGQIHNANAYTVSAQISTAGAEVMRVDWVPDAYEATVRALRTGLTADLLVICGGVSVGEHDHVKRALTELGVEQVFWGVALRPGKPTWFGVHEQSGAQEASDSGRDSSAVGKLGERRQGTLVFGLPGNPVSAMVTFQLFVRLAIAAMIGAKPVHRTVAAIMDVDYPKQPGRAHAIRCRLKLRDDGWHVRPTKEQGSHILTSMLGAEALALLAIDRGPVRAGERVEVELL